jgi:transposase
MQQDSAQSAASTDGCTLTAGLDLSDSFTQCCIIDADGTVIEEGRVRTTTSALQRRFSVLPPSRVVLEAGTHSPWVSRLLTQLGHEVIVANVRQVALIGRNDRKDDRSDAERLARLGRVDPRLLAPIRHRGPEAQQALAVLRSRDALVRSRTLLINHVRGAVKAWGVQLPRSTAPAFHHRAADHIPEPLRAALQPLLEVIGQLSAQIARADAEVEALCQRYPETAALRQVTGVGALTALAYILTIEDPARFSRSRDVGPYLGLVPRRRDSGGQSSQLGISKAGDVYLRRLLVSCAHYVLGPFGPDCDLRRWGQRHSSGGAKNATKRAVVAVARKLAVLLHALWVSGTVYEPLRLATATTH